MKLTSLTLEPRTAECAKSIHLIYFYTQNFLSYWKKKRKKKTFNVSLPLCLDYMLSSLNPAELSAWTQRHGNQHRGGLAEIQERMMTTWHEELTRRSKLWFWLSERATEKSPRSEYWCRYSWTAQVILIGSLWWPTQYLNYKRITSSLH